MAKTVRFIISKDGSKVTSDAEGFVGGECHHKIDGILQHLGKVSDSQDKKPMTNKQAIRI